MAIVARVRSAALQRQVGAWNSDTVISTLIENHVCARWHVAFDASCARRIYFVEMMFRRIVLLCGMTLHTKIVAGDPKRGTVRLVTIAASNSGVEHPALDEGAVLVIFLLYLPIREIVVFIKQRDAVIVAYWLTMHIIFVNLAAPRVASRTHLYFSF